MPQVNVKVMITARLLAQYGNFRIIPTNTGGEIRRPAKYLKPITQVPPAFIEIKGIEYETFLDDINAIMASMEFNHDYVELKSILDNMDISKINVPKTIPVSEVPMEYITVDNGTTNKHVITADGIDGNGTMGVPGIDCDAEDGDELFIESVCRYVSPNFIYQKSEWYTSMDLYEWEFVNKEKPAKPSSRFDGIIKPLKQVLNDLFHK